MKYQLISKTEKQTKIGTIYECLVTDEQGVEHEKVAFFPSNWPDIASLAPASVIEGELVVKQNGQYVNKTMYPPKTQGGNGGMSGGRGVKAAQERKAEYIREAQERKEESIAFFNATNSAIEIVSRILPSSEPQLIRETIVKWRDWFLEEWRRYEASDSTDKRTPF